jgi:ubiquinol-cytochrome c reductase cytochrome b subunit/menaquinol-cytochrome c reductase cytochrome b/c subunit
VSRARDEKRAQFQRYKEDVKAEGKPFYPYAMFHDTVMSLVVVSVIFGLACVWYFTSGEDPEEVGWIGSRYSEEADPGTTSFTPRPDWYFYFLFYLLRIFKWPESVILGTVGIPTILLVLIIALPFLDMRRERRLLRRPVAVVTVIVTAISMGVLTYKGATAQEFLASDAERVIPEWQAKQGLPENALPGARLFAGSGCLTCHTYLGAGSSNLGAPDLTAEGAKNKGIEFQVEHLKCPSCTTPGSPMPPFASLGEENLRQVAIFLEASKGPKE